MKIHLAGNLISVGTYFVQRCLLCGEVMQEGNARNMASSDGGSVVSPFVVGGFYAISKSGGVTGFSLISEASSTHFESDLDLPDECCIRRNTNDR